MKLRTVIEIALHERGILVEDGVAVRALQPGRHVVWFSNVSVVRYDTRQLVVDLPAEHLVLLPASDVRVVTLEETERALVVRRGRPVRWLGTGTHMIWTVDKIGDKP